MVFIKLIQALALGLIIFLVCLLIAFLAFPLLLVALPFLAGITFGILAIIIGAIILWVILYGLIMIGVFFFYLFKPMKVSKNEGKYSIGKIKESGRRSEG